MNISKACILTIDDEETLRESIAAYLEDSGFTVLQAKNGIEGMKMVDTHMPDVVLSDLQMPHMDGLQVLAHITQNYPHIPVIVVSGAGKMDDAIEALRLGAWDYLLKPIKDMAALEHAIQKCLERIRLEKELQNRNDALQKSLAELKEDQEAGRRVQCRLLPPTSKKIGQYDLSYKITPSLYLSGDFVDYFEITPTQFGFYIADVSGHGAASAFVTVLVKNIIEKILGRFHYGHDHTILYPHKVLAEVSAELFAASLGKYLTIIFMVLDHQQHTITYSVGGHYPQPLLITPKSIQFLQGNGMLVGITPQTQYTSHTCDLEPESSLVMFSDGILEITHGQSLEEKETRLSTTLKHSALNAEDISKAVGLVQHDPVNLVDDVGILVLTRTE